MSNTRDDPFAVIEQAAGRQAAEEQAARALAAARVKLILGRDAKSAFFATLVLRLTPEPKRVSIGILMRNGKLGLAAEKFCQCAKEAFSAIRQAR